MKPELVVAPGATAARSVMNRTVVKIREGGTILTPAAGCKGLVTGGARLTPRRQAEEHSPSSEGVSFQPMS